MRCRLSNSVRTQQWKWGVKTREWKLWLIQCMKAGIWVLRTWCYCCPSTGNNKSGTDSAQHVRNSHVDKKAQIKSRADQFPAHTPTAWHVLGKPSSICVEAQDDNLHNVSLIKWRRHFKGIRSLVAFSFPRAPTHIHHTLTELWNWKTVDTLQFLFCELRLEPQAATKTI